MALPNIFASKKGEKPPERAHIERRLDKIKSKENNDEVTDDVEKLVRALANGDG